MCHSQLRNLRNMVVAKVTETATLTLVRANKSRGGGHWSDDDYDVREGSRVIGPGDDRFQGAVSGGMKADRRFAYALQIWIIRQGPPEAGCMPRGGPSSIR